MLFTINNQFICKFPRQGPETFHGKLTLNLKEHQQRSTTDQNLTISQVQLDGSEIGGSSSGRFVIPLNVTEVGTDPSIQVQACKLPCSIG